MRRRETKTLRGWLGLALSMWALTATPSMATAGLAPLDTLDEAGNAITAMEVDRARKLLSTFDAALPKVSFQLGRLALEVGDCDEAVRRFSPTAVQALEDAGALLEVSRNCARAMSSTIVVEDAEHKVLVRLQDDADRPLVPLIGETAALHRETLKKDLGVEMPTPTRIDVVRDQFSLSALTGLPHKAAQTTGTVAVAKFGRVIMLSPRAPTLGYGWRDTLAHEMTHLALTRGTHDHAPLWLQEGVAKREETRWRPPAVTDEAVPSDAVAAAGLALGLGRPLDGIGPSIALLPSAKEAMVVYAEVTSFVRFIAGDRAGAPGAITDVTTLPKLLSAYDRGLDTDAALKEVTGKDLKAWNGVWRPWVATRTGKLPAMLGLEPSAGAVSKDKAAHSTLREQGRTFRVGELLLGRSHPKAAKSRLDPLMTQLGGDPLIAARAAAAHLLDGDAAGANAMLEPAVLTGDLGIWWAVRGDALVALHASGSDITAAYEAAVAHDPFGEPAACGLAAALESSAPGSDPAPTTPLAVLAKGLCKAAQARMLPKAGQD